MIIKRSEKRIALVTDRYEIGGGLEHIFQIVWGMKDLHFGIFANGGQNVERFSKLENVEVFDDGYDPDKIKAFNPSIIHFHHLKPIFRCAISPVRFNGSTIVYTAHGIHIHKYEFMNGLQNRIRYYLRKNVEKYVYRFSDEVIVVSDEDRDYIGKHYQRDDCHFIPNGIDFSRINGSNLPKNLLRERLGLPAYGRLFLTVARFNFQKGYDILLDAVSRCRQQIADSGILFLLVGNGEEQSRIRELSSKLNISDKIIFLGLRKDVYDLMRACDYLILPSRWEGHPISLIEA
jgi:glycosyltransferase involved in cell wall biosynthesis